MPLTRESLALPLSHFWVKQGCSQLPASGLALPSASLHPEIFFPLFGAGPWRAFCLEPISRPLDSRRGEHPCRLARPLHLHVVLKPSPDEIPSTFLESLEASGCNLRSHDVRFADWPWEEPSLTAQGPGWRVLVDGLAVARLTLLQQAAGQELVPPALEIAYDLDCLALALGSARDVFQEAGTWRRQEEADLTTYVREIADPEFLRRHGDALVAEAERCLAARLARPAYCLAVQSLEAVDLLAARGELAAGERDARRGQVERLVRTAVELAVLVEAEPAERRQVGGGHG